MAFKSHQVKKHNYSFDARTGGLSSIQLWGTQGMIDEGEN